MKTIAGGFGGEQGATAVEYAIMVALIAAVIIASVALVGSSTDENFDCVSNAFNAAPAAVNC